MKQMCRRSKLLTAANKTKIVIWKVPIYNKEIGKKMLDSSKMVN